jgi:hypothetical protein
MQKIHNNNQVGQNFFDQGRSYVKNKIIRKNDGDFAPYPLCFIAYI